VVVVAAEEVGLGLVADEVARLLLKAAPDVVEDLDLVVAALHENQELQKQNVPNESKRNLLGRRWHLFWRSHRRTLASGICVSDLRWKTSDDNGGHGVQDEMDGATSSSRRVIERLVVIAWTRLPIEELYYSMRAVLRFLVGIEICSGCYVVGSTMEYGQKL
jgi:hypothetical protein